MTDNTPENKFQPIVFLRFGKKEHIKSFIENGTIYMNTVSYFKNLEGDNERADKNENITGLHQANTIKMHINGKEIKGLTNQVTFYIPEQDKHIATHVYCLSHISGDVREDGKLIDDRVKDFGEALVAIYPPHEFVKRINEKLDELYKNGEILRAHTGCVEYIDKGSYSGDMSIFKKTNDYAHQREFRITVTRPYDLQNPFEFNIGNLTDIAQVIETKKFKNKVKVDEQGQTIISI
jgi:hypothetical protein